MFPYYAMKLAQVLHEERIREARWYNELALIRKDKRAKRNK